MTDPRDTPPPPTEAATSARGRGRMLRDDDAEAEAARVESGVKASKARTARRVPELALSRAIALQTKQG
jgi:hypothetical protein